MIRQIASGVIIAPVMMLGIWLFMVQLAEYGW